MIPNNLIAVIGSFTAYPVTLRIATKLHLMGLDSVGVQLFQDFDIYRRSCSMLTKIIRHMRLIEGGQQPITPELRELAEATGIE